MGAAAVQRRGPYALRGAALVIAVLGVVDPSFRRERSVRGEIAVVATDASASPALVQRVRDVLARDFTVLDAAYGEAAATVLVGSSLPAHDLPGNAPLFAVVPSGRGVRVAGVAHPREASLDAGARIDVALDVRGASGDSVTVTLREGGVALERVARAVKNAADGASGASRVVVPVTFMPARAGAASLRVEAALTGRGDADSAAADVAIAVREARRAVLFHDPRPSWMSLFVRRAVERDPRLVVTSRVVTSRGISTDAGRPPVDLASAAAVAPFDVIVLGAPEALSAREIAGLDAYMRRRGGSVLLLLDQRAPGAYERLLRVPAWTTGVENAGIALVRADAGASTPAQAADSARPPALRATEWAAPSVLPAGAASLVEVPAPRGARGPRSVVWRTQAGAGTLVVSGALDAWRHRDAASSDFAGFWRDLVGTLADEAVPPLAAAIEPVVVAPGAEAELRVAVRDRWDPAVDASPVTLSAAVAGQDGGMVRLWPASIPGSLAGRFRAPAEPGRYRVDVVATGTGLDSARAVAELVVAPQPMAPVAGTTALLTLLTRSRGGLALADTAVPMLPSAIARALPPSRRVVVWHPMRSPWWILPFAGLLAAEWYLRRRRGLA